MARRPDIDLDLPDLDLDTSSVRAKPSAAAPEPASTALDYFGKGSFDDDDFDSSSEVALDLEGAPRAEPAPSALPEPPVARGVTATGQVWPAGASPARDALTFEPLELSALGGYGSVPRGIHLAPLYTWRVLRGQRALRARLAGLDRQLAEAEAARDEELARLVTELRPELDGKSRFAEVLAPLAQLEREAQEQGQALAATNAELSTEIGKLELRRDNVERESALRREEETHAQAALAEREHQLARVEAQHKRALIEIRNVEQLALQTAAPGTPMPPELGARVTEQKTLLQGIEPELAARRETARAAGAALALVQQKLAELERERAAVTAARRALDQRFRPTLNARGQSAAQADARRRSAFAEAGRAVLTAKGAVTVPAPLLASVASAEAQIEALARDSEKHLRALDAFDRGVFEAGRNLAIGVAIALLLLLLLLILL